MTLHTWGKSIQTRRQITGWFQARGPRGAASRSGTSISQLNQFLLNNGQKIVCAMLKFVRQRFLLLLGQALLCEKCGKDV